MNKIINVIEYNLKKLLDTSFNSNFIYAKDIYKNYGYYAIANEYGIIVDLDYDTNNDLICLANNINIPFEIIKTKEIVLNFDELNTTKLLAPEFGVTINNNLNIQQFNLKFSEINISPEIIRQIISNINSLLIWNFNEILLYNNQKFTKEKVINILNSIQNDGYERIPTMYIDFCVKPYDNEEVFYWMLLLGRETFPVRVITYIDVKYVKNFSNTVYNKICNLPLNKFYKRLNEVNCLDMSPITNYSDKRNILNKYRKPIPDEVRNNKNFIELTKINSMEILFFFFKGEWEYKNDELIKEILSNKIFDHKYFTSYKKENVYGMFECSMSERIFNYIHGYVIYEEYNHNNAIENDFVIDNIELIGFDPSLYIFDTFEYDHLKLDEYPHIVNILNSVNKLITLRKSRTYLIPIDNFHEYLNDENLKVAILDITQ